MNPIYKNDNITKNEQILLIGGILNSDLTVLMRELTGRTASGQAMNRNECMVYETKSIKIPDPRIINKDDAKEIILQFVDLIKLYDKPDKIDINKIKEKRHLLNEAVLNSISINSRAKELEESVEELLNIRENGRGLNKKIPFTYSGNKIAPKIKGAKVIKSIKQLKLNDML